MEHACLERCLHSLREDERDLVVAYYQADVSRPGQRRMLAGKHTLSVENLRQRTHRLRKRLRACLQQCVAAGGAPVTTVPRPTSPGER